MLGEVDLGEGTLVLDLVNGFLDLRLRPAHRAAAALRSVVTAVVGDGRDSGGRG